MANTYTQIHIQAVFAVKRRECLIKDPWRNDLYKYIGGIIRNQGHKVLAINGMPDHIHIFFGMKPVQALSELIKYVKGDSSEWVNQQRFIRTRFSWQEGFGAFSYSRSQISNVISYIDRQEEHHSRTSFREEYLHFLKTFDVEYDARYLFENIAL